MFFFKFRLGKMVIQFLTMISGFMRQD